MYQLPHLSSLLSPDGQYALPRFVGHRAKVKSMIRCIHENREGIVLKFKRNTIKLIDSGGKAVC
jgi:hypothetical protein